MADSTCPIILAINIHLAWREALDLIRLNYFLKFPKSNSFFGSSSQSVDGWFHHCEIKKSAPTLAPFFEIRSTDKDWDLCRSSENAAEFIWVFMSRKEARREQIKIWPFEKSTTSWNPSSSTESSRQSYHGRVPAYKGKILWDSLSSFVNTYTCMFWISHTF